MLQSGAGHHLLAAADWGWSLGMQRALSSWVLSLLGVSWACTKDGEASSMEHHAVWPCPSVKQPTEVVCRVKAEMYLRARQGAAPFRADSASAAVWRQPSNRPGRSWPQAGRNESADLSSNADHPQGALCLDIQCIKAPHMQLGHAALLVSLCTAAYLMRVFVCVCHACLAMQLHISSLQPACIAR